MYLVLVYMFLIQSSYTKFQNHHKHQEKPNPSLSCRVIFTAGPYPLRWLAWHGHRQQVSWRNWETGPYCSKRNKVCINNQSKKMIKIKESKKKVAIYRSM